MNGDDRGQLILVAALGLAVAFVALAVVLNAVVFTENIATRNPARADDALGYEGAVEQGVGGLVALANEHDNADYETLRAAVNDSLATWSENASFLGAVRGSVRTASLHSVENGTLVVQSHERAFTDAQGDADWRLAAAVNGTRRFHAVVTPRSGTVAFNVTDGSAWWRVEVRPAGADETVVARSGSALAGTTTDTHEADTVSLDLTEGTLNGTTLSNWTFGAGVSAPYDVRVENGDTATGRYVAVVDRERVDMLDDVPEGTYESRRADAAPTTVPAVYRALVDVSVHRSVLTYETNVAVQPGRAPVPDFLVGGEASAAHRQVLYVDPATGHLTGLTPDGRTVYDATNVGVLGPAVNDFDGDARVEVPYVTTGGSLELIDARNRTQTWRTSADANPPEPTSSRLATGAWNGGPYAALYADDGGTSVYAANDSTGPSTQLHQSGNGVGAVVGVADVDGDGADELVFGDGSQQLRYRDQDGSEVKISGGGYGQTAAPGVGPPADFDGDGEARVPFVDGSNNLKIVDAAGNVVTVVSSGDRTVDKTPVAPYDWDRDGDPEVMFVSAGELWYADDVAGSPTAKQVTVDLDGDGTDEAVPVDAGVGLA